ncbi:MAG TPA: O-acetyl-ADP-ribose deacetylase [Pyrinomonadaceae bacterium]|jgi:Predicted phosphatase homologous to the C-terminal domain of histone macroH2A1|nr:O-acetyl-ADP-ribose deacetylase [Pyrinomonadaceae bacterium]
MSSTGLEFEASFLNGRVIVLVSDITRQEVSAIVNAANSTLLGGGGVDGAIHREGGPAILKECREIRRTRYPNGLPTGEAVVTTGGNLPAKFVIHTVGPIYGRNKDEEATLLAACYQNSLLVASEHQLATIAFPSISTGAFGYPRDEAAAISSAAIANSLAGRQTIEQVRLVFFQPSDAKVFLQYQIFE